MRPKQLFKKLKKQHRSILTVEEALNILTSYKIPIAKGGLAKNEQESMQIAKKIGFPVAMKVVSKDIVHKTDVKGLLLNLDSTEEVSKGFTKIMKDVKKKLPKAKIEGVLIQRMVDGQELIIGGKKDPQFNQVLMFGLGGIFTEVFDDVTFRVVPLKQEDAEQMTKEIKGYKILEGYRGKKYNLKGLANILLKTSKLLEENQEIKELDINPLFISEKDVTAVDARITIG
jgi:acetyl-CoA synthetase (ADP-forming)